LAHDFPSGPRDLFRRLQRNDEFGRLIDGGSKLRTPQFFAGVVMGSCLLALALFLLPAQTRADVQDGVVKLAPAGLVLTMDAEWQ